MRRNGPLALVSLLSTIALMALLYGPAAPQALQAGGSAPVNAIELPIIMYHSVLNSEDKAGAYVVTAKQLERDLAYIQALGYTTVVVQDLLDYVYGGVPLPDKPVMLTFDDGYYNNYTYLYPLLEQYDMKAVLSIIAVHTEQYTQSGERNNNYTHITWPQLREVAAAGRIEIQNHTYDMHSERTRRGAVSVQGESFSHYKEAITEDILQAQKMIQANTGWTCTAFTYPFGFYTNQSEAIVRSMGFRCSLTCVEGMNYIDRDPSCLFALKRWNRASGLGSEAFFRDKLHA